MEVMKDEVSFKATKGKRSDAVEEGRSTEPVDRIVLSRSVRVSHLFGTAKKIRRKMGRMTRRID